MPNPSSYPYIIYRITNTVNNKLYIGQTTTSLDKRRGEYKRKYRHHHERSRILQAMVKYGFDAFVFETIDGAESFAELNDMERYWIAFYHTTDPSLGYNILAGGHNGKRSDIGKQNISKAMVAYYAEGNVPHNLGKSPSEETRKRMSEGLKRSIRVKGYGKRSRKEVQCVETGKIYPSITTAALAEGFSPASLCGHLKGKSKTCNGYHWNATDNETASVYSSSPNMLTLHEKNSQRQKQQTGKRGCPVLCVETGEIFPSMSVAGQKHNLDKRLIFVAIEDGNKSGGYHWKRLGPKRKTNVRGLQSTARAVRCVETGKIYPSLKVAARNYDIDNTTIWVAIRDNGTAAGVHWVYV